MAGWRPAAKIGMDRRLSFERNTETLQKSIENSDARATPFRHWLVDRVFEDDVIEALVALPFDAPRVEYSKGARAANNDTRSYFDPGRRDEFPVCQTVAEGFQNAETVKKIEAMCDIDLSGTYLRLEYAQDRDGFWLHPHKDISVKCLSMLVYLSDAPEGEDWGTDIYSGPKEEDYFAPTPHQKNRALIFVPGSDTWHGFRCKPISGIRQTLIVNFVTDAWNSTHELAYPDQPV
ncbi:MAG: 2OG-Fe(II) oxygenase [Rhodospirillaceae bacterium]